MKQNKFYIVSIALVVAIGGFLLGFDSAVISGAVGAIKKNFALNEVELGWAASSIIWGAMGGNAMAGPLSDRFGRKKVLIVTALLFAASALISATATSFTAFIVSRLMGGVAVGWAILIAPVYIAEIAPSKLRGSLVSFNQLMIVLGISASFFSNYLLGSDYFVARLGENSWRWMLGVEAIPAVLYLLLLFVVPESPRWLFGKGQEQRAREIFTKVAGVEHAEEELRNIQQSAVERKSRVSLGGLFGRRMSFIMFIALAIAFFQQITGINAIFYYLPTIFAQAGGSQDAALGQAVVVGLVNVFMTFVAIWLIDRLGRKPLLAIGAAGMAISLLTCAWAFHASDYQLTDKSFALMEKSKVPADLIAELQNAEKIVFSTDKEFIAYFETKLGAERIKPHADSLKSAGLNIKASLVLFAIIGFVASFAISLGPVMWVLLSEIFPNEYRGAAISVVGFWNSVVSASVTLIFPWELAHWGSAGTFLGYGMMALAGLFFVILFIPETKQKTLEELEGVLVRQ